MRDAFEELQQPYVGAPIPAGTTFEAIGVDYDANPVPIVDSDSWLNYIADIGDYIPGAWDGSVELIAQIRQAVEDCGDTDQNLIVGGYSQGAWATHAALQYLNSIESPLIAHIDAVLLIADPLKSDELSAIQNRGTAAVGDGVGATYLGFAGIGFIDFVKDIAFELNDFGEVPNVRMNDFSFPSELVSRTLHFCDTGDIVCDMSYHLAWFRFLQADLLADGAETHTQYGDSRFNGLGAALRDLAG